MPDSRSRSRSPRRSSGPPLNKDKDRKPSSRELITIKTETKEDGKSTPSKSSSAANNTTTSSTKDTDREKTERRKPESTAPKSNNNSSPGWNPPSSKIKERKFSGRCRLFVGNLLNCSEDELKEMFQKYGEVSEVFVNKERGFGFIRLDTRLNAEAAKQAVDGSYRMGRTLAVRFATHASALKVLNLGPMATNELLHQAFSQFGDVERAVVVCDDRGRSKGYGVVEFARKHPAQQALQQVNDGLFLLGRTPCPVSVKQLEHEEDEDGISDEALKRQPNFQKEREAPPHFASPNTFESEWAQRWRALEEMEVHQKEALDIQFKEAREKLDIEMNQAIQEHEAMLMRQEIQRRQEELQRFEEMRKRDEILRQAELRRQEEMRLQEELQRREEELRHKEEMFRQQQKELQRHWKDDVYPKDSGGRRMDTNFRPGPGLGPGLFPKGGSGGDWAMGPGPSMGLGHPGPMGNNPRLGPGMMPPRGPPHMGGPPGVGPPRGRIGPRMPPTRPMRFDSDRDRDRDMVDRDRLAARSRDSSARDRGDYKRPRY